MKEAKKNDIILRLNRIEGQVRGIHKMIEEDRDCEAVLQQISAVRSALFRVGIAYISENIKKCMDGESDCHPDVLKKIQELVENLSKFG